mmetsp:Transcript_9964/g.22654  ORF Transcript_9964/g.22654 Transcript_9964/m.22654 type:complete len:308 (+) Transcript_9964:62-985(+)
MTSILLGLQSSQHPQSDATPTSQVARRRGRPMPWCVRLGLGITAADFVGGTVWAMVWTTGAVTDQSVTVTLTFCTCTFFLFDVLYRSFSRLKDKLWASIWTCTLLASFLVHSLSFVPKVLGLQEPMLVTIVTILMFMLVLSATIIIHSESMIVDPARTNPQYEIPRPKYPMEHNGILQKTFSVCENVADCEGQEEPTICAICMCPLSAGESASRLVCSHLYHTSCIGPWLQQSIHHGCPMRCRRPSMKIQPLALALQASPLEVAQPASESPTEGAAGAGRVVHPANSSPTLEQRSEASLGSGLDILI